MERMVYKDFSFERGVQGGERGFDWYNALTGAVSIRCESAHGTSGMNG